MADKTPDTASPPAGPVVNGKIQLPDGRWVFAKGNKLGRTRKGINNKVTGEIKTFAQNLLMSEDYKASATKRVIEGTAPHLETLLHHYAWGKPADTLKFSGERPPFMLILGPRRDPLAEPEEPLALPSHTTP